MGLEKERKKRRDPDMATKGSTIDKGGFVENVANASPEPEEKKVRGQQFSYAEMGGVLAQDVEDRRGFEDGGSTTLDRWQLALEQHGPTKLTPEEIRSEEHFQRIKDEPGLRESAPLMQTAAALYGIPRSTVSAFKGIRDVRDIRRLKKLQESGLYHGGYGWQSGYHRKGLHGEKLWRPENIALWSTPSVNYAKVHARRRGEQLSSRTFDQHGKGASNIGVWQAKTSDINKFVILDRPSKQFKSQIKDEIIRLKNNKADPKTIKNLQNYLANPKQYKHTHNIGYKGSKEEPILNLLKKHNYDGVVALQDFQTIMKGGLKAAQSQSQFVFLRRPELNKLSNEKVREMMDAAGFKKFYNEGGLVEDMDRLGFAEGDEVTYGRGANWFMNTILGSSPYGAMKFWRRILGRFNLDERQKINTLVTGLDSAIDWMDKSFVDPAKERISTEKGIEKARGKEAEREAALDESGYGSLLKRSRTERKADRIARQEEGGGLLSRIFGSGEITDDTRYAMRDRNTLLSNLAARAGPRNPYTSLATRGRNKSLERTTSRGDDEREANIAASYAAHRRVHYAEGGPADLDVLLDDLKIAYDSLSPEEESELLRMIE